MKPLAMLASEASGRMKVGKSSRFDNFGEVEAVEIYEETTQVCGITGEVYRYIQKQVNHLTCKL